MRGCFQLGERALHLAAMVVELQWANDRTYDGRARHVLDELSKFETWDVSKPEACCSGRVVCGSIHSNSDFMIQEQLLSFV